MPPTTMDTTAAIAVEAVTCRFGKRLALDALSLSVARGTVLGIVGPNGAGKTTLIEVICGLFPPTQGRVTVLGQDVRKQSRDVRRRIGLVPQETALYEDVTPLQNLRFAAALYGIARPGPRITALLELVGLSDRARDVVRTLSGGMQRRLAIARALLHDPAVLILDEPTVGVDVEARHLIWGHVRALRAEGRTVLLTTNYLDEAEALCDSVAILQAGRLLVQDTPAALLQRTGRCLELHCPEGPQPRLVHALRANPAVLRLEESATGLTAYIDGATSPEEVVRAAMAVTPLDSFRTRSPDLHEIFRVLAAEHVA